MIELFLIILAAAVIFYAGVFSARLATNKKIEDLNDQIDKLITVNYESILKLEEAEDLIFKLITER